MLKITPYMATILFIISLGGLWYPKLGYGMVLIMLTLMMTSPFSGRWFCGNLCPRGSFNDHWLSKISRHKQIPKTFKSLWLRVPVLALMMGFMLFRVFQSEGIVDKIGMVFVSMCIITTVIAIIVGISYAPRAWCTFCPMGTVQRTLGGKKMKLLVDMKKCIKCGKCAKVCPMHLGMKQIFHDPDCIKCGKCIAICPVDAMRFK